MAQRADVLGIGSHATGLAFDEECKLVYGVLLSLRSMMKKLSGRGEAEGFQSYRTSSYKFHFFETASGYKFVLLSDPLADNMQFALKALHSGPFLDFVVRNDFVGVRGGGLDECWGIEAEKGKVRGKGIDNDRVSRSYIYMRREICKANMVHYSSGPLWIGISEGLATSVYEFAMTSYKCRIMFYSTTLSNTRLSTVTCTIHCDISCLFAALRNLSRWVASSRRGRVTVHSLPSVPSGNRALVNDSG